MSEDEQNIGMIGWIDLTVPNATKVRNFYESVVGWEHQDVSMGDYNDFSMFVPGSEQAMAGICHNRGANADLPAQWLMYINVADLDKSIAQCEKLGGKVVAGPKDFGPEARYCVIQDPAGAHVALFCEQG